MAEREVKKWFREGWCTHEGATARDGMDFGIAKWESGSVGEERAAR